MVAVPEDVIHPTIKAIYEAYEAKRERSQRPHLGASLIGKECERALWYDFRWVTEKDHEGRLLRLFQTGHLQEERMVRDLRAAGVTVQDVDPDTGRQWSVSACGGHFGGSMDGVAIGLHEAPATWHVLEFKTHNAKSFAALQKDGVAKSKPQHFAQMQVYMHLGNLTRAFYLAVNKDTDALYCERVEHDAAFAERLLARAERVIFGARPPARIHTDPAWYQCRFCDSHKVCHEGKLPEINCRTCLSSTAMEDGTWRCERHACALSVDDQRNACKAHLYHPDLIHGEPVGGDDDHVVYQMKDGSTWKDGPK